MSEQLQPHDLILFPELQRLVPLSRTTLWRLERAGKFPRRIAISKKRVAWRRTAIEAWLERRAVASIPSFLERLLEEIRIAEDETEVAAIRERYRDELEALSPTACEEANELIEDAIRERR